MKKVTEIDGAAIFADKDGYFLHVANSPYHVVRTRLGKTAKEVETAIANDRNWCYRAWHGEMDTILKAQEEVRKLPDIPPTGIPNVTIHDNGACFMIQVNGLQVKACSSLGEAWKHIVWMHRVASQQFTVGKEEIPVTDWIDRMKKAGYLD